MVKKVFLFEKPCRNNDWKELGRGGWLTGMVQVQEKVGTTAETSILYHLSRLRE